MSKWLLDDDGTIEELKNLDFELVTSDPNLSYDISKMADSDNKNRKLIEEAASYLLSLDRSLWNSGKVYWFGQCRGLRIH